MLKNGIEKVQPVRAFDSRGSRLVVCSIALFIAAGCGGGSVQTTPVSPPAASLAAAIATGCVYPATSAQTVALPAAGGVSGTISVAAFAQASTTCLTTTVATGADTSNSTDTQTLSGTRKPQAASTLPKPLAQVSLSDTYSGNVTMTGIQLTVPTSLPDGSYPATITTDVLGVPYTMTYTIVVSNGHLNTPTLTTEINPGSLATLSIYPQGTVFPSPSPSASPSTSPSPAPSATAIPTASPAPTASAGPTSTPIPTPGPNGIYGSPYNTSQNAVLGSYSYTYGGVCPPGGISGSACSSSNIPLLYGGYEGGSVVMQIPTEFYGTVTFSIAAASPFAAASYAINGACPTNNSYNIGLAGGSITVPPGPSVIPAGVTDQCVFDFSTLPPGAQGGGYTLSAYFEQISF